MDVKKNQNAKGDWGVYENNFCSYIKQESTGRIQSVILKPDGQVIDTFHLNIIVHDNGIEFLQDEQSQMKYLN